MKEIILGNHIRKVPSVAVGCMRLSEKSKDEMNRFIHAALEQGAYLFDHADIYGDGMSESIFGEAFADDSSIKREDIYLQSKCGIRQGFYDLSKEHILKSVDGILQRLHTCLLYTSDAADEEDSVDLGGRRIIKKKTRRRTSCKLNASDTQTKNNRATRSLQLDNSIIK